MSSKDPVTREEHMAAYRAMLEETKKYIDGGFAAFDAKIDRFISHTDAAFADSSRRIGNLEAKGHEIDKTHIKIDATLVRLSDQIGMVNSRLSEKKEDTRWVVVTCITVAGVVFCCPSICGRKCIMTDNSLRWGLIVIVGLMILIETFVLTRNFS